MDSLHPNQPARAKWLDCLTFVEGCRFESIIKLLGPGEIDGLQDASVQNCKLCTGPEVIKLFSCSTQLSMKFKLLINIEIAKINGFFSVISSKPVIYPANKC